MYAPLKLVLAILLFALLFGVVGGAIFGVWLLLAPYSPVLALAVIAALLLGGEWLFRGMRKGDDSKNRNDWGI